jgi:hypothetical protein
MVNQIDAIFAKVKGSKDSSSRIAKSLKTDRQPKSVLLGEPGKQTRKANKKKAGSSSDPFATATQLNKAQLDYTDEGWKIYTPQELSIGNGGDTDLCPFDCQCCF